MKKILIIIIFFINSCGYQPIYINKDTDSLEFSKISLIGDKDINRKILNSLNISENSSNMLEKQLMLETSYKIDETSKNSKGQIASYRSQIIVLFKIVTFLFWGYNSAVSRALLTKSRRHIAFSLPDFF